MKTVGSTLILTGDSGSKDGKAVVVGSLAGDVVVDTVVVGKGRTGVVATSAPDAVEVVNSRGGIRVESGKEGAGVVVIGVIVVGIIVVGGLVSGVAEVSGLSVVVSGGIVVVEYWVSIVVTGAVEVGVIVVGTIVVGGLVSGVAEVSGLSVVVSGGIVVVEYWVSIVVTGAVEVSGASVVVSGVIVVVEIIAVESVNPVKDVVLVGFVVEVVGVSNVVGSMAESIGGVEVVDSRGIVVVRGSIIKG